MAVAVAVAVAVEVPEDELAVVEAVEPVDGFSVVVVAAAAAVATAAVDDVSTPPVVAAVAVSTVVAVVVAAAVASIVAVAAAVVVVVAAVDSPIVAAFELPLRGDAVVQLLAVQLLSFVVLLAAAVAAKQLVALHTFGVALLPVAQKLAFDVPLLPFSFGVLLRPVSDVLLLLPPVSYAHLHAFVAHLHAFYILSLIHISEPTRPY